MDFQPPGQRPYAGQALAGFEVAGEDLDLDLRRDLLADGHPRPLIEEYLHGRDYGSRMAVRPHHPRSAERRARDARPTVTLYEVSQRLRAPRGIWAYFFTVRRTP